MHPIQIQRTAQKQRAGLLKVLQVTLLSALLSCLMLSVSIRAASAGDLAIIVNSSVDVDNLSLAEVRQIFLGDKQFWTDDLRVTLLVRAPVAHERDVVLKSIYRMTEAQFRQYWISKVFRAETPTGPKIVYSSDMAADLVEQIPGSITFIDVSQVPEGAKVLRIDGKLPGEKGYPLH